MVLFFNNLVLSSLEDRLGGFMESGQGKGEDAMASFIQGFLNFAVPLGVFTALVLVGYAAFIMVTSAGDQEKLKEAREVATNAIIGAVMIALGVIVLSVLDRALGTNIGS